MGRGVGLWMVLVVVFAILLTSHGLWMAPQSAPQGGELEAAPAPAAVPSAAGSPSTSDVNLNALVAAEGRTPPPDLTQQYAFYPLMRVGGFALCLAGTALLVLFAFGFLIANHEWERSLRRKAALAGVALLLLGGGAVAGVNVLAQQATDTLTRCDGNLYALDEALHAYAQDHEGEYPAFLAEISGTQYLKDIPKCPAAHADTYSAGYVVTEAGDGFTIMCSGDHHADAGVPMHHPMITSEDPLPAP